MADYNKFKVTELKEELKNRGIAITGLKLKQQFIDKLLESDLSNPSKHENPVATDDASERFSEGSGQTQQNVDHEAKKAATDDAPDKRMGDALVADIEPSDQETAPFEQGRRELLFESHSPAASYQQQTATAEQPFAQSSSEAADVVMEVTIPPAASQTPPLTRALPSSATATPDAIQSEIRDDSKKRKRRSLTPPPLTVDVAQKRARMLGGASAALADAGRSLSLSPNTEEVSEKTSSISRSNSTTLQITKPVEVANGKMPEVSPTPHTSSATQDLVNADSKPPKEESRGSQGQEDQKDQRPDGTKESQAAELGDTQELKTPSRKSTGGDARFKGLVRPDPQSVESPDHDHDVEEDRVVLPALHPATSSLYVRNLKRPLQLPALKSHLVSLATPSRSSPQSEMVKTFYLDGIKTHALVSFANVSAASRVRSALHDTRWPEEKSREALWVDFIPDEKIDEWIEMERTSGGSLTRWEVVYSNDGDRVQAVLQEVGSTRKAPHVPQAAETNHYADGMHSNRASIVHPDRAALVSRDGARRPSQSSTDPATRIGGNGFKALDDLFPSTRAKPKLYFKPVPERLAASRKERFRDLLQVPEMRGRGADQEMRRYSFEDGDYWVDKGPEFGLAVGHPGRYRGRGGGRGSSYLGRINRLDESWRGRGY